ncbi:MAG: hypothetical protein QXF35_03490 [Candidatus Bilamarchaeaceae archaeon]
MRKLESILFFISILVVIVLLAFFTNSQKEILKEENQSTCVNNSTKICYIGKCEGQKICNNGRWSDCTITFLCVPGSISNCVLNNCVRAYKVCNECGTGYSECIPLNEILNNT